MKYLIRFLKHETKISSVKIVIFIAEMYLVI